MKSESVKTFNVYRNTSRVSLLYCIGCLGLSVTWDTWVRGRVGGGSYTFSLKDPQRNQVVDFKLETLNLTKQNPARMLTWFPKIFREI